MSRPNFGITSSEESVGSQILQKTKVSRYTAVGLPTDASYASGEAVNFAGISVTGNDIQAAGLDTISIVKPGVYAYSYDVAVTVDVPLAFSIVDGNTTTIPLEHVASITGTAPKVISKSGLLSTANSVTVQLINRGNAITGVANITVAGNVVPAVSFRLYRIGDL